MIKIENQNNNGNGLPLSGFLKRRRLEMGLKLEDLSNGVCSISHLSRIENNLVDIDDEQYQALFEKLNINYEQVKVTRQKNVYEALLREFIKNNNGEIEELVNEALNSNSYCSIEVELMVLFYNIINENYEEARKLLMKLENISNTLTNNELLFYLYSLALYAFNTNQLVLAYRQILVLTNIELNNSFFKAVVYDLAIDIMINVNQVCLAYEYFRLFEKTVEMPLFGERYNLHKLQLLKFSSDINYEKTQNKMKKIASTLDLSNNKTNLLFNYYKALILYYNHQYQEVSNLILNTKIDAKLSSILVSIALKTTNYTMQQDIMKRLDQLKFTKYEKLYSDYYQYLKLVMEGNSNYTLYNYIKNILMISEPYYDGFVNNEVINEYLDKCSGASKYKEGIRFIKKELNLSIHQKLK